MVKKKPAKKRTSTPSTPSTSPSRSPLTSKSPRTTPSSDGSTPKRTPAPSFYEDAGGKSARGRSPSFRQGGDVGIKPPIAATFGALVKSTKEIDDDYQYLPRTKHGGPPFKQLLVSNIALTIFNIVLLASWIGLFYYFIFGYYDSIKAPPPGDLMDLMMAVCRKQFEATRDQTESENKTCFYIQGRFHADCTQPITCASVTLGIDVINGTMHGGELLQVFKFKPLSSQTDYAAAPDFTPCANGSWCVRGSCEQAPNEDRVRTHSTEKSQDGEWRVNCRVEDIQCFSVRATETIGYSHGTECPKKDDVCNVKSSYKPQKYVRFAFRSCNHKLPKYDGKPCWGDYSSVENEESLVGAVVTTDVCGECPSPATGPKDCEISTESGKECTLTCSSGASGNDTYYLPDHYSCKLANGKEGYCYHGNCAEFISSKECDHTQEQS